MVPFPFCQNHHKQSTVTAQTYFNQLKLHSSECFTVNWLHRMPIMCLIYLWIYVTKTLYYWHQHEKNVWYCHWNSHKILQYVFFFFDNVIRHEQWRIHKPDDRRIAEIQWIFGYISNLMTFSIEYSEQFDFFIFIKCINGMRFAIWYTHFMCRKLKHMYLEKTLQ